MTGHVFTTFLRRTVGLSPRMDGTYSTPGHGMVLAGPWSLNLAIHFAARSPDRPKQSATAPRVRLTATTRRSPPRTSHYFESRRSVRASDNE